MDLKDGLIRLPTKNKNEIVDVFVKVDHEKKLINVLSNDRTKSKELSFTEFDEFILAIIEYQTAREEFSEYVNVLTREQEEEILKKTVMNTTEILVDKFYECFGAFLENNPVTPSQYINVSLSILSSVTNTIVNQVISEVKKDNKHDPNIEQIIQKIFLHIMSNLHNQNCDCPVHAKTLH